MRLPPPLGPNASAYLGVLDAAGASAQALADHCHAATRMRQALAAATDYIDAHADYRAPRVGAPVESGPYRLDAFMTEAYMLARRLAARALGPSAEVRMIAPMWVHTYQQAVINDVITLPHFEPAGLTWRAYAIAAADRVPSLIMMSWDWAGAFPCATPDATEADTEPIDIRNDESAA